MDRMSPLDAMFLHVEDGVSHMHIASCAIFEGPAPDFDDLVGLIRSKLPLVPRYRQRVRFVPGAVGRPVWVDDPHFRLEYHVRHTALPAPGSDDDLRRLMGRLMSQELDRHRPLWETWIVEGLAEGTWAMISKVHHCMVDGVSGTDLMAVVLDPSPEGSEPEPDHWEPEPEPSDTDLVRHAIGETLASPNEMARWVRSGLRRPRGLVEGGREVLDGALSLGRTLQPNVELSIEGSIGPHRRWTWTSTTLEEIKTIRTALGGTVNDVVLAAITNGYRQLLLHRGDPVDGVAVRTLVPVSVRGTGDHSLNNQVSGMIAELPVGVDDPLERLAAVRDHMVELKSSHQADAGGIVTELAEFAPPVVLSLGLRTAVSVLRRVPQRSVNTVTTNVPGPQIPLYACGREMLEYLPFVPLSYGVRTGVAILSYNGRVAFGLTGDYDTVPDLDVLAAGIADAMAELLALSRPARRRASTTSKR